MEYRPRGVVGRVETAQAKGDAAAEEVAVSEVDDSATLLTALPAQSVGELEPRALFEIEAYEPGVGVDRCANAREEPGGDELGAGGRDVFAAIDVANVETRDLRSPGVAGRARPEK